jgi:putative chitinase
MEITVDILSVCLPDAEQAKLEMLCEGINETFEHFEINTPERMAMFLAQAAHESGNFHALEENLNYSATGLIGTWPKRFTQSVADQCARKPQAIANKVYCNRLGNGDEASNDGWNYRGRGLIQLTGKDNYLHCGNALGIDLVSDPEQVAHNPVAVLSAGWFWDTRRLNQYADQSDVTTVTKIINGGSLGLNERKAHYTHILSVLQQIV